MRKFLAATTLTASILAGTAGIAAAQLPPEIVQSIHSSPGVAAFWRLLATNPPVWVHLNGPGFHYMQTGMWEAFTAHLTPIGGDPTVTVSIPVTTVNYNGQVLSFGGPTSMLLSDAQSGNFTIIAGP